jgi:hypothetical protein
MKTILLLFFFLTWLVPRALAQIPAADSVSVTILLKNKKISVDSVFIIFDRYDLTGAGIIRKVFYPSHNQIVIEKVPRGKYYVDVYCIGVDHQNFTRISTVGRRRSNRVTVPLKTFETYIPGTAIIPPSTVNLNNLIVTRKSPFR